MNIYEEQLQELRNITSALGHCGQALAGLAKKLEAARPLFVDEKARADNETAITVEPEHRGLVLVRVHSITAAVSSTPATLTIGDRSIPITQTGPTVLQNLGWLLRATDTRKLTQNGAGAILLEITGEVVPTQGMH